MLRTLARIERAFETLAVVILAAIMLVATADVAMRYLFNRPFSWTYDLISMYLMVALFYLVLSSTFADNGHIRVDLFSRHMPRPLRRFSEIIICASAMVLFGVIAYAGGVRSIAAFQSGDVAAGFIPWPTWPSIVLVPVGAGLMALRLLLHVVAHAMAVTTGREVLPLSVETGEVFGRSSSPR